MSYDVILPPVEAEAFLDRKQLLLPGGKRATNRTWKNSYTVLCGQLLCFFKNKDDFAASKASCPPLNIHNAICTVAEDYQKRKHTFSTRTFKTYAGTAYVHRHNAALRVLYYHLRHSYGVLLDHQQKTMFVIEFSAPAEVNIISKEEEKRIKYQELLGQLRRLWPDYTVSLLVMIIGSLGGMRNTLLSALRAMLVCRAAAHILAARMHKAKLLGQLRRLWPDYAVSLLVMVIGPLGGMRNTLLSALRAMPVCRAAAHILAARMQKAVILGSLRLLKAHDTRTQ
nr:unnamed protein product [Callosobruchus chinensis]